MWDRLQKQLRISEGPHAGYKLLPKPDVGVLDAFEKHTGLALPESYRQFVALFGAGELAGFFRIAAPMPIQDDYDLNTFNRNLHGEPDERLLAVFGPPEVLEAFFFFAATGGDSFFGWKVDEVTDQATHEYAIYEFPGFPPYRMIAHNFEDFINRYVMQPSTSRKWKPENVFLPFEIED
jgi:hypothetical protein